MYGLSIPLWFWNSVRVNSRHSTLDIQWTTWKNYHHHPTLVRVKSTPLKDHYKDEEERIWGVRGRRYKALTNGILAFLGFELDDWAFIFHLFFSIFIKVEMIWWLFLYIHLWFFFFNYLKNTKSPKLDDQLLSRDGRINYTCAKDK